VKKIGTGGPDRTAILRRPILLRARGFRLKKKRKIGPKNQEKQEG